MSPEREDQLLRHFHEQGDTWSEAIGKVDEIKFHEEEEYWRNESRA